MATSMNLPKQLLENPDTSVLDVGTTAQNMPDNQKAELWTKYSKDDKTIDTSQIPNIIYDIFCQTVKEKDNKAEIPEFNKYEEQLNQISQWIISNKLTKTTISKLQYKSQFALWILEAGRKKVKVDHPSAQLLLQGSVHGKSDRIELEETYEAKSRKFYDEKFARTVSQETQARRGTLHGPTRSIFFSEKVEVGYLIQKDSYLYDDAKLTKKSDINNGQMIAKGSVLGGPKMNKPITQNGKKKAMTVNLISVAVTEPRPLMGYISISNVKEIDISNPKWKFEYSHVFENQNKNGHKPTETTVLHTNDIPNNNNNNNNNTNNEDDEKMSVEEKTWDLGNPNDPQARAALLNKYKENIHAIQSIKKKKRSEDQVMTLWTSAFNTHNMDVLADCYSDTIVSQQLVDQQLVGKDAVLASFKQMFDSSHDIGLNVTNKIVGNDMIVLEWKAWGTKTPSPSVSATHSPKGSSYQNGGKFEMNSDNNNHNDNNSSDSGSSNNRFINGCGIFHVKNGVIKAQRLFWDQDVNWFSDMGVLKIPLSELHPILYANRQVLPPQLSSDSNNGDGTSNDTIDSNSLEYELLERRGLIMKDLKNDRNDQFCKRRRQFATGLFWLGVGVVFMYVVPKYLGKGKKWFSESS